MERSVPNSNSTVVIELVAFNSPLLVRLKYFDVFEPQHLT